MEIGPRITVTRPGERFEVDREFVPRARRGLETPDPIVAREPKRKETVRVLGVLRELSRQVDPYKKLRIPTTAVGRGFLGEIGKTAVGRITVHSPIHGTPRWESFTAWIPSELLREPRIGRNFTVYAELEALSIPGHGYVWYCRRFEVVG
ncbi:MAG: hypothetical protein KatS3mg076_2176 [Candidatus Binatia bacterium]|nr:MAG: hypothetical protein KatS3mg076_2176 [Candidatus Binatia bacterium]